jgi:hypothetical protein
MSRRAYAAEDPERNGGTPTAITLERERGPYPESFGLRRFASIPRHSGTAEVSRSASLPTREARLAVRAATSPSSAIRSAYGAPNTTPSTTGEPLPAVGATVPSVSSPTKAQTVKKTLSKRRGDLIGLAFSLRDGRAVDARG